MATKPRDKPVATEPDDLTLERVHAWLKERARQLEEYLQHFPFTATGADRIVAPLFAEIDAVCSRLQAAEDIAKHLREVQTLAIAFDARAESTVPSQHSMRTTPTSSAKPNGHSRARWRKRPMTDDERNGVRLTLLRARADSPKSLASAKREVSERYGLSSNGVAGLLTTCAARRFALGFAARTVARTAPQQRTQLVGELSRLLGIKQRAIVRAVRDR